MMIAIDQVLQVVSNPNNQTQIVEAVNQSASDSTVALVLAIVSLLGVAASIIAAFAKILENTRGHDKNVDMLQKISQTLGYVAKETVINKEKLRGVTEASLQLNPDLEKYLIEHQAEIDQSTNKLVKTKKDLTKLLENLPVDVDLTDTNNNGIPDIIEIEPKKESTLKKN